MSVLRGCPTEGASRRRMLWMLMSSAVGMVTVVGCAGQVVRPSDLPGRPVAAVRTNWVAVLDVAPPAMADEVRAFAQASGTLREVAADPGGLVRLCQHAGDVVLRPKQGRTHFASNAADRNTLLVYESAIVVGLPVTLISAAAWSWYGETTTEGELEWLSCREDRSIRRLVRSFRLRSEGKGFIRGKTIEEAQEDAASRGVTRKLLKALSEREGDIP